MKNSYKSSLSKRPWHSNRLKQLEPISRILKHSYPDQSDSRRFIGECLGPIGPRPSFEDLWSCLTNFWDFDRLSKMKHKTKHKSRDLGPFLGIFGFFSYVMGMGMLSHGFTHA